MITPISRRIFSVFVRGALIFCGTLSVLAADQPPIWQLPHFSADPKVLYSAATESAHADQDYVSVLDSESNYSFDINGRLTETYYLVYKVLSQKGVNGWDSLARNWEPWHEERPAIRARVITPDFAVHELDPKTVSDAPESDDDESIYQDRRVVRAPLPAIAPDSVVEMQITRVSTPLFPGAGYVDYLYWGRVGVPEQHDQLTLEFPSTLPVQYSFQNLSDLKPDRSEADGRIKLVFQSGSLPAQDGEDFYLPTGMVENPMIEFAVGTTWQRAADGYAKVVERTLGSARVDSLVAKLTKGMTTNPEKEKAILAYIDKEVRYTGIEFGQNAVVPHAVEETLTRKYGDCKDKALLMVSMLRAAGIPAYMALLNSGRALGIAQDLPGTSLFNHAIVYVPGKPELWIDPTDEYAQLGQIPLTDQGQFALVIRKETENLLQIPEDSSQANRLIEIREFHLAENGPARIVETNHPRGGYEARWRRAYADKQDKKTDEDLTSYFKTQYRSEKLDRWDRTDPSDLSRPFELVLEADKAKRGFTDLNSSVAAITNGNLFSSLPNMLQHREDPDEKSSVTGKPKRKRTLDYELPEAFVKEWHYRIIPPLGFQADALPHDAKIGIGPARLSEQFSVDGSGVIHADLQFDTVKRRFTVAEASELRNKVAEIQAGEAILVSLVPRGRALLQQGKIQEAFQSYRQLIAEHPTEAVHHLQLAQALVDAGLGEAARKEAQSAVKLEPNSALAEKTLASMLEYDLVGRKFRSGSDYAGAADAFQAAAKLDPKDKAILGDWGILLEYNPDGLRYGPGARLKESVAVYRKLTKEDLSEIDLQANLEYALFYDGQFAEARQGAEALNPQPRGLIVACEAALNGEQAALQELSKRGTSEADQKATAKVAAEMLMKIRKYPLAATLFEFGASGDNAAQTMALASNLRQAQLHEQITLGDTPKDLVLRSFILMNEPNLTLEKLEGLSSKNARIVMRAEDSEEKEKELKAGAQIRHSLARQDLSMDFLFDLSARAFAPKGEGTDKTGYREKIDLPNGKSTTSFVVKENGQYRILDSLDNPNAVALEILDRINASDLDGAKVLLDWVREDQHLSGGDDPLAGFVFPRFWARGEAADANQMKLAAAAMMTQTKPTAAQGVAILEEAQKSAKTELERTNLDIALFEGYQTLDNFEKTLTVASRLSAQFADSVRLFKTDVWALSHLNRLREAQELISDRLKRFPDDNDAAEEQIRIDILQRNYGAAYDFARQRADAGKASASDLNQTAWTTLYFNRAGGPDVETALKSTQMEPDNGPSLHTLACLYAEVGKTKEAYEVSVHAMDLAELDEPDSAFWYTFGRLAEQFGETDVALEDYAKVKKPKFEVDIPGSTYQLAQNRLEVIKNGSMKGETSPKKGIDGM